MVEDVDPVLELQPIEKSSDVRAKRLGVLSVWAHEQHIQ